MAARHAVEKVVIAAIIETLSIDEIADLEAIYLVGRGREFSEHYDSILQHARERRHVDDDLWEAVHYLVQKTNLQSAVASGLTILGRPDLAERIETIGR
jgi:hypothetical protein